MPRGPFGALAALVAFAAGCAALVGLGDHELAPDVDADAANAEPPADAAPDTAVADARDADADANADADAAPSACNPAMVATDPANCGKCGHACLGGACSGGACAPVELANGQGHPTWMAIDGRDVFWTDGATVRACAVGGCPAPRVVATVSGSTITGIAAAGGNVYVATCNAADGDVLKCPASGCGDAGLGVRRCVRSLTVDEGAAVVYLTDDYSGVFRCPTSGCTGPASPVAMYPTGYPWGLAVDGQHRVFWVDNTSNDALYACTRPACAQGEVTGLVPSPGGDFHAVAPPAVTANTITFGTFRWGNAAEQFDPSYLLTVPANQGQVIQVVLEQDGGVGAAGSILDKVSAGWVVASGAALYFTDIGGGAIGSCTADACDSTLTAVALGQSVPFALVQDDAAIYWANYGDGRILKLAK